MQETITKLKSIGIEPWIEPKAGIFVWCRLPEGVDAAKIAQFCLNRQVILAPVMPLAKHNQQVNLSVLILLNQIMIIFIRLLQKHFYKSR